MSNRALVLLLGLLVACGVKGRPVDPELVRPGAPTQLLAKSTPGGVRLTWRRPTEYTSGKHMRDLGGFEIERATGADSIEFTQVGKVELTDQTRFRQDKSMEWTDATAAVGTTYRYQVISFTLDNYRSAPAGLLIEYTGKPEPPPPASKPPPAPAR